MQRSKQSQRLLVLSLQFLRSSKQEKHCISCEQSGAWKLAGSCGLLPAFWKVPNQLPVDVARGDRVACGDQFPMQLCNVVTTRFPPLCNHFEMGIEPGPELRRFVFREGAMSQPARDGGMTYPYLNSDGRLREALLSQSHDLLIVGQTLCSLRQTFLCVFGILFRRSFALHGRERGRS